MATIKSYTSMEQSRKLVEFLLLESADMSWVSNGLGKPFARTIPIKGDPEELCGCWSLAALLSVLPKKVEIADNVYSLSIYLTGLYYWNVNNGNLLLEVKDKDNLVNACVAMIEKLHELKML